MITHGCAIKDGQIVEKTTYGRYMLLFVVIDENEHFMNYRYRLLCFADKNPYPGLALNPIFQIGGLVAWGPIHNRDILILGHAISICPLVDFRSWALGTIPNFLH